MFDENIGETRDVADNDVDAHSVVIVTSLALRICCSAYTHAQPPMMLSQAQPDGGVDSKLYHSGRLLTRSY